MYKIPAFFEKLEDGTCRITLPYLDSFVSEGYSLNDVLCKAQKEIYEFVEDLEEIKYLPLSDSNIDLYFDEEYWKDLQEIRQGVIEGEDGLYREVQFTNNQLTINFGPITKENLYYTQDERISIVEDLVSSGEPITIITYNKSYEVEVEKRFTTWYDCEYDSIPDLYEVHYEIPVISCKEKEME